MVTVSNRVIHRHLDSRLLSKAFRFLENDTETQSYLKMANVMAVKRLGYNDHGPVHAKIIAGSALEIFSLLTDVVEPSSVMNGVCDYDDARLIVLLGALLTSNLLDRLLLKLYDSDPGLAYRIKSEVLHAIYSSDNSVPCLSVEAGIVTVADGTDMAEGRSRIPYLSGKNDINAISAQAINKVYIVRGDVKPVSIQVFMDNPAGIFQIEEVIGIKIKSSGIGELVEVIATMNGREIKTL